MKVAARVAGIDDAMRRRASVFAERVDVQHAAFQPARLPDHDDRLLSANRRRPESPRRARQGALTDEPTNRFLQDQTAHTVRWQEDIGLDVLVHGEFERNDMVQYFGEQLAGFAFTKTAGCNPTDRATSVRRSCSATSRARAR